MTATCVALIPARSGSKRVVGKNVRPLAGHPLLAYTVSAARESGVFADVIVSTDAESIAEIARHYGAEVPFLRPSEMAGDLSPDIDWVRYTLETLARAGRTWDAFSLLRPTSPFRRPETIRRAWRTFLDGDGRELAARGRAVPAASGQDVGRRGGPDRAAAQGRPVRSTMAQHAVSGPAEGADAEREPGDRLVPDGH